MPKVDDPFAGHVLPGDPRALVTGAFGCTWPTLPAYRYRIQSNDATLAWAVWNNGGVLVQLTTDPEDNDFPKWEMLGAQPPFEFVHWWKEPATTELDGYTWRLEWKLIGNPLNLLDFLPVDSGRCNVDVSLPNWSSGPSFPGSFGTTARADQVIYDQTEPP